MVSSGVDRRFPHRLSGRPRGGRQCHLITMLREIDGSKRYTYAHEGHTHGVRSSQQVGHACPWNVQPRPVRTLA